MRNKSALLPGSPLGERIVEALDDELRTVNSLEVELKMSRGHLGRIVRGKRASRNVDVELCKRMASILHVEWAWLALGDGPKRRGGRGSTPAERAIIFCRGLGAREDAIQAAWQNLGQSAEKMTEADWVAAIDAEARRLTESSPVRPEVVAEKQAATRRVKDKKVRQKVAAAATAQAATAAAAKAYSSKKTG